MDIEVIYPFDPALNAAIETMASHYVGYYIVSDNAPSTFQQLKDHLDGGNVMVVACEGSSYTIFGDAAVNFAFRAWHDWCHWVGDFDFSLYGECATCNMQLGQLYAHFGVTPETKHWAKLITAEVIGQRRYYEKYREYIADQRAFTRAYLDNPEVALSKRW